MCVCSRASEMYALQLVEQLIERKHINAQQYVVPRKTNTTKEYQKPIPPPEKPTLHHPQLNSGYCAPTLALIHMIPVLPVPPIMDAHKVCKD